ncbi:MAG: hypothetical protein LBG81_01285 [Coriobacteriaceae bacterium]|jgi:glutamate--cysteine ligase|nr:hypothetical protein [Coriobacteriaceae bacterium]
MKKTGQPAQEAMAASVPQPMREANIAALVAYFESGIKPAREDAVAEAVHKNERLGIELEHIIVESTTLAPVSYSEENGILWVLEQFREDYPEAYHDIAGDLLGLSRPGAAISLEPAAQLELSAGPFASLAEAMSCYEGFEARLAQILAQVGKRVVFTGYHPTARMRDLELIPKRRYKFMNAYLGEIGEAGPCMMLGSASTQVSIDYHSVEDCLLKLRVACALVPILALICDNSPIFEGRPRTHHLVRTKIWQDCDPERCGLVPGVMDPGFSLRRYAEYILDTPAILIPCKNKEWCYAEEVFGELYAEKEMDSRAIEHAVSMFFNDVRLKTYIEIRPADAMPVPHVIAYAALIKGLFYDPENLARLAEAFMQVNGKDVEAAKVSLMKRGYHAAVYGRPVGEWADELMEMAACSLGAEEAPYLAPLAELVARRTTLAELCPLADSASLPDSA